MTRADLSAVVRRLVELLDRAIWSWRSDYLDDHRRAIREDFHALVAELRSEGFRLDSNLTADPRGQTTGVPPPGEASGAATFTKTGEGQ